VASRGRTVPFTLRSGDSKKALDLYVAPVNAYVDPTALSPDTGELVKSIPNRTERLGATVTLLDDGRLLIAGGANTSSSATGINGPGDIAKVFANAELYDPSTGVFTEVGPMTIPRAFHQAVKLLDGRVVLLGGWSEDGGTIATTYRVEAFNPDSGEFVSADPDPNANRSLLGAGGRAAFTASLCDAKSGRILIAGGVSEYPEVAQSMDVYIFDVGTTKHVPLLAISEDADGARYNHTMTYLPAYGPSASPAYVLMGGENAGGTLGRVEPWTVGGDCSPVLDEAAVVDLPATARTLHNAVFVPQQHLIYVAGGFQEKGLKSPTDRIDVYWEADANFKMVDRGFPNDQFLLLGSARGAAAATLMDQNTIFISGGLDANGAAMSSTEVVLQTSADCGGTPCAVPNVLTDRTPALGTARFGHLSIFDATRKVLLVGGMAQRAVPVAVDASAVYYNPE
jgi:hypothetical protein